MDFLAMVQERGLGEVLAPIICTAYGTVANAVEALRDYGVVDFINKANFQAETLLLALNRALERQNCAGRVKIELKGDLPLSVLWDHRDWVQSEDPIELDAELQDLFRRLFPRADYLWIQPLTTTQDDCTLVTAKPTYPFTPDVIDDVTYVVKFGPREQVRREIRNYADYLDLYKSSRSSTQVKGAGGRVFGAIRYRLVGIDASHTNSLAAAFLHSDIAEIGSILDNLVRHTLRGWYQHREPRRQYDLVELYVNTLEMNWPEIWNCAAQCGIDTSVPVLEFPGVTRSFTNPRQWLESCSYVVSRSATLTTTHGNLNEHNILIGENTHCWLIDFRHTGRSHILRDIVRLEIAIKFHLTSIVSLAERATFEESLQFRITPPTSLSISSQEPYAKAVQAILYLRSLAYELPGVEGNMEEYQIALLLETLNLLRPQRSGDDANVRSQILLSAAMICSSMNIHSKQCM